MPRWASAFLFLLFACENSVDPSLESKECSLLGECLPGYVCSEDNLCVRSALSSPQNNQEDAGLTEPPPNSGVITGKDPSFCDPASLCGGACVDLQSDPMNCGGCGRGCPSSPEGRAACRDGSCVVECDEAAGYSSCSDGCFRLQDDPLHCGDCSFSCPAPANGAALCDAGQCSVSCAEGFESCAGQCVRLEVDPANCGACGTVCAPDQQCSKAACVRACPDGTMECARSCVDVRSDPQHCGMCGAACNAPANAAAMCQDSSCSWQCSEGFQACNGACVDWQTDAANCGACGNACTVAPAHGRPACVAGACAVHCDDGYGDCDGLCVLSTLIEAGGRDLSCSRLASLQDLGQCQGMGQNSMFCDGSCVNPSNDPAHCGRCGRTCDEGERCLLSDCRRF